MDAALARAYSDTGGAWQQGPGRVYDRLAERLIAISPVPLNGRTILDVGAGTGAATRALRAVGARSVAVDLAAGMLRAIGPVLPPSIVADARSLPLRSGQLDGVVAAFSFNHVPDPERALAEATRVVRAGSPVLVSAYAADDHHPVKTAVDTAAMELGWTPAPWLTELRVSSIPILATIEGARAVAKTAGLGQADVMAIDVAYPDLDVDDLVGWRCGMAQIAPFVARLEPAQRADLRERAKELLGSAPVLIRHMIVLSAVT